MQAGRLTLDVYGALPSASEIIVTLLQEMLHLTSGFHDPPVTETSEVTFVPGVAVSATESLALAGQPPEVNVWLTHVFLSARVGPVKV